eukprot:TRINITY_DN836_c0_g1_i1.p1 TRINITY_DN836_c0_g1~~TRINITY_DN836_c0_g1_i1.p1  ORF type:complete len:164 (+),score=52.25 TRINITY_DN836_c0_g1_i1:27-518(+)
MRAIHGCLDYFSIPEVEYREQYIFFFFFFLMIRRPPRSTQGVSSAASDVYKRQVSLEDIAQLYKVESHPKFISGQKTKKEILEEFLGQWDTIKKDGIVTIEEFEDYYKDVSASIDRDDYFELMIRNAWKLPEPKGKGKGKTVTFKEEVRHGYEENAAAFFGDV